MFINNYGKILEHNIKRNDNTKTINKKETCKTFWPFPQKSCNVNSRHSLELIAALAIIYSIFIVVNQCKHIDL